jgi:O-antigen ligase
MTNVSLGGREGTDVADKMQLSLRYGNFFRATSIFSEPSSLASFNMVVISFLAAPYIQGFKPFIKSKAFSIFAFALAAITMFITFSMTGVIGLLMLIAGIFLFERIKKIASFVAVFVIGIVVILLTDGLIKDNLGICVVSLFEKRIGGLVGSREKAAGESVGSRLTSGKKGMQIWEDNPVIGSGLGLTAYNKKVKLNFTDFSVVSVFAETGTIGGIVWAL